MITEVLLVLEGVTMPLLLHSFPFWAIISDSEESWRVDPMYVWAEFKKLHITNHEKQLAYLI